MPRSRLVSITAALGAVALMAACAGTMGPTEPPDPCNQTTEFTFLGRTSPQALGITGPMDPMAAQVGTAWVTAGPVDWGGGGPGAQSRALCIQFDDGSGMGQSIEDDWEVPAGVFGAAGDDDGGSASLGLLAAIGMLVLVAVVSLLAFGRDGVRRFGA